MGVNAPSPVTTTLLRFMGSNLHENTAFTHKVYRKKDAVVLDRGILCSICFLVGNNNGQNKISEGTSSRTIKIKP
jgi:hypothetical protein